MAPIDWFDNDELFFEQLDVGHRAAEQVAADLRQAGLSARVTPMEVRATVADAGAFSDEFDILVGARKPCRIDVKSRKLAFDGPTTYPYPTALVDTVGGWRRKTHKPLAIVLVSQKTPGGRAVVRVSSAANWTEKRRVDRERQIADWFFEVDCRLLATFEELVGWLHARESE